MEELYVYLMLPVVGAFWWLLMGAIAVGAVLAAPLQLITWPW